MSQCDAFTTFSMCMFGVSSLSNVTSNYSILFTDDIIQSIKERICALDV